MADDLIPEITRADFIRGLALAGLGALIEPPSKAHAAAPIEQKVGENEAFQQKKATCHTRLTLEYRLGDGREFVELGEWMQGHNLLSDMYGSGDLVSQFELKIAEKLGKQAACWMPTGTMAQLIALRIFAERSASRTIGWHPSSHHLLHERNAYSHVHSLELHVLCEWDRPILARDIDAAPALAAASIELPVRWIGQMQTWQQLQDIKITAQARGLPLLMDGARLWEAQPYYGRSYSQICDGFDAVYVSFYKMIGGPGGAMLLGDADLIDQARIWRHRLGGNLFQNAAYIGAAMMRFDKVLAEIPRYYDVAKKLAVELHDVDRIIVMPSIPQTNLFRVFLPGDPAELVERRDEIAAATGIWVGDYFRKSRVPGLSQVELQIADGLDENRIRDAVAAFANLLS